MTLKIALAGNPNSGKTTLFNALTGSHQYVGNWPGVTVEKKEGQFKKNKDILITDLPGIYSLSPYTLEEVVARNYLIDEDVDVIVNIVDGMNLERNLYLTTQLLELGIPTIIAINMMDLVKKNHNDIHLDKLKEALGCPVVEISALKEIGIEDVIHEATKIANQDFHCIHYFSNDIEEALESIEKKLPDNILTTKKRFFAIKLFERDQQIKEKLPTNINVENIIEKIEEKEDDDSESIITNERYQLITAIMNKCNYHKNINQLSISDKIDRIVTNRWLALPIFALVMWLVYYLSVTTIGTLATDFVNEHVFGEGFKFLGMFIPSIPSLVTMGLEAIGCAAWLQGLIVDGIIAGVGAVLGFVPQMLVLFFLLAILEACGYMARIAFIMDRIFKKFGLSGKSFIPMLIGTGCGVPAIMASRTIENDRDRKMTIITTTFIPCSAKLPIIALISGALFGGASWVAPSAYFIGMIAIVVSGIILKKTKLFAGDPAPFVMELPAYHFPSISHVLKSAWERGWSFIKKAGTIILLSTMIVWFTSYFGFVDGHWRMLDATELNHSLLAMLGNGIAWVFTPLGFGHWQGAVATLTGLVAKENVVGTFGILYGFAEVAEDGVEYWPLLANHFTIVSAYAFLVFNLLCAPCFAAMGAIKREMNNQKWFAFAIGYQTLFAYVIALIIYQIGTFLISGQFQLGTVVALGLIVMIIYLIVKPYKENQNEKEDVVYDAVDL
ncbi:MAG: ferrous iron transport protein B [Longibaculum sp.]